MVINQPVYINEVWLTYGDTLDAIQFKSKNVLFLSMLKLMGEKILDLSLDLDLDLDVFFPDSYCIFPPSFVETNMQTKQRTNGLAMLGLMGKISEGCSSYIGTTKSSWMTWTGARSVFQWIRRDVQSAAGSLLLQVEVQPLIADVYPAGGLVKVNCGGLEWEMEFDRCRICQCCLCPASLSNVLSAQQ